jgi:O-antigen biosynthesis protein
MKLSAVARRLRRSPRMNAQLVVQRLAQRLGIDELDNPLNLDDLTDSSSISESRPGVRLAVGSPPRLAWVVVPAGAGSGGHTTLFRMMQAARVAGFHNTLLFYNRFDADLDHYANIVRQAWPWLDCDIAGVDEHIEGFDGVVASSWATAHVVASRTTADTRRLYFIQDYEPYFFPRGETYAFAEDTYRFGFRNIALGEMVHATLLSEVGAPSDLVPFGADTKTFTLEGGGRRRSGVVFYARPGNERRGFRLAVLALARFHAEHPDQPIHVYGADVTLPFPTVNHGTVSPAGLSEIYNSVIAGLALSFTNVSLAPEEMLAAGTIPVVNEHDDVRAVLDNPFVVWATATPTALAEALSAAVSHPDISARALDAARSVEGRSWRPTEEAVVEVLADDLGLTLADGRLVAG